MERVRGLIVREEYIRLILSGRKRWEIRRTNTRVRGLVALVSRGMLYGFVEIVDSFPVDVEELKERADMHGVEPGFVERYAAGRRRLYVWVVERPLRLPRPVPVRYARGAQVWAQISLGEVVSSLRDAGMADVAEEVLRRVRRYGGRR